jgi:hypothetical protein
LNRCPHEAICPFREMRAPDRSGVFNFEVPGIMRRIGRRFEQSVTSWPQTQPTINIQQPPAIPSGPLNPGEEMRRTLDERADIRPQARMGLQCAGYVVVLAGCVTVGIIWRPSIPLVSIIGAGDLVAAAVFVRLNWDILIKGDDQRLVTRRRIPEQPVKDPNIVHVKAELHEGRRTLYDEFDINDYAAWHKFCKAVHVEGRNFSQTESERNKVPPSDWDTVSTEWTRRGWLKQTGRRKTPELRGAGKAWVRAYATTPPTTKGR